MNLIEVFQKFPTQESCIAFLEKARWDDKPECPYCCGHKISKHASSDRAMGRWQCQSCNKAFAVTVNTIFHRTHIPLQKWFLALSLILNAKKGVSNRQLGRDLGLPSNTAWRLAKRIREAFLNGPQEMLKGIVEMDETYIGGKSNKKGRGTDKMAVLGVVERGGNAVAQTAKGKVNGKNLMAFIKGHVDSSAAQLFTDQYKGYSQACAILPHSTVNHSLEYVTSEGVHTNTIEGLWALVKRAWYGQHHHYSPKYADLYLAEACYKYNHRDIKDSFYDSVSRLLCK